VVVPVLGQHAGAELDAETRESQDHFSVRVLRESLFHPLTGSNKPLIM
jgi:hypothetical protein